MPKSASLLFILLFAWGCANIKAPTGGPRDETAPVVLAADPPTETVNFNQQSFSLTFDEWVQLRDIRTQLLISPPLERSPEVTLRKRTVTVSWEEPLRPNTTYTFFFGDGIQDFTEGNSPENLSYVFSTGPELDTLQISGKLITAEKGEAVGNLKVLAYASEGDSLALRELPDYFAQADKDGFFEIRNMREGAYEVIAIGDENRNYLLDEGEMVGFHTERVVAAVPDTVPGDLAIRCNPQPAFTQYIKGYEPDSSGHVAVQLSRFTDELTITDLDLPERAIRTRWNEARDSVHFWLRGEPTESRVPVEISAGSEVLDTLNVPFYKREDRALALGLIEEGRVDGRKAITLRTSNYIDRLNAEGFTAVIDSIPRVIPAELNPEDPREVLVRPGLKDGAIYDLIILPNAVISVEGWALRDTISRGFANFVSDEFAELNIALTGFHDPQELLFQLLDQKDLVTKTLQATANGPLVANRLTPGTYKVRWINDRNGNGRWDGCDYIGRVPAEEVDYLPETIQARSNWVLDVEWIVKE